MLALQSDGFIPIDNCDVNDGTSFSSFAFVQHFANLSSLTIFVSDRPFTTVSIFMSSVGSISDKHFKTHSLI